MEDTVVDVEDAVVDIDDAVVDDVEDDVEDESRADEESKLASVPLDFDSKVSFDELICALSVRFD